MEVLAIVAYKQPITIAEINQIRGVDSDYGLKQLVEKRLVGEVGRRSAPGRPVLYATTQQFLHVFNLQSLDDLPDIDLSSELTKAIGRDHPADQPALPDLSEGDDE